MSANFQLLELETALRSHRELYADAYLFPGIVRAIGRHEHDEPALADIKRLTAGVNNLTKAVSDAVMLEDFWRSPGGIDLTNSWLASIGQFSVLDLVKQFAVPIPENVGSLLVASGAAANVTAEGYPKAVTRLTLTPNSGQRIKIAAILVFSAELNRASGAAAHRLLKHELTQAVVAQFNSSILAGLTTTGVAATGSALGDLKAGIAAAADSYHYVVAAARDVVRELAFSSEGRIGPEGGEFLPGVWIVPVDDDGDSSGKTMTVIPADRMGVVDWPLVVRNSSQADVMMSDTPTSPGQMTSLWQTNCHGILVEREYRLVQQANAVEVG
jgi:hypothetical protein